MKYADVYNITDWLWNENWGRNCQRYQDQTCTDRFCSAKFRQRDNVSFRNMSRQLAIFRKLCLTYAAYAWTHTAGILQISKITHCATKRKVTGSILYGVIGMSHWNNHSGRTMALGSNEPLTELSTRNRNLDALGSRSEISGKFCDVVLEKKGEYRLDRLCEKLRSVTWSQRVLYKNILHEISKRKANWICHILRRNCLLR
jgi:hypothetical protein